MYHFFIEPGHTPDMSLVTITGEDFHHIAHVLRMKKGEEVSLSIRGGDGREYRYGIEDITDDAVYLRLRFVKEDSVELDGTVTLYQALPKADKMELIIQKAVELGVSRIVPVACARSIVRLDDSRAQKKTARWQSIAESAAKQSKRGIIPEVSLPMSFSAAVSDAAACSSLRFLPYELASADAMSRTRELIDSIPAGASVSVMIGPEGGFTEEEVSAAVSAGFRTVTMGRRILRTETAALTFLSWLMYRME